MKKCIAVLVAMCVVGVVVAQTNGKHCIDVTQEPSYRLLLDNSSVRAFRLELPPGKSTELHFHDYDFMTVTLRDSTVNEVIMRPATAEDARAHILTAGEMANYVLKKDFGTAWRTLAGIAHTMSNNTDKPYRNVTFEMKHGYKSVADGEALVLKSGETAKKDWVETDHLLIAMNELEVSDTTGDKQTPIHLATGEVAWIARGTTHVFANTGTKGAVITSYEFK